MPTTTKNFKTERVNEVANALDTLTSKIYINEVLSALDKKQDINTNLTELWQTYEALVEDLANLNKAITKLEKELV